MVIRPVKQKMGFSPHAWGWSEITGPDGSQLLVLPTRVGMVRQAEATSPRTARSPHTRGDGPGAKSREAQAWRFSPHAWGWSVPEITGFYQPTVLPTRVGMVRTPAWCRHNRRRSPHTRGDGPATLPAAPFRVAFSPHAWGWSVRALHPCGWHAVLPTRVGMVRGNP